MNDTDLAQLRSAIDGDRKRLCVALNLRPDGNRYFCPRCQSDGAQHADGDFSIEAGFRCHKCGLSADGFGLVQEVKHCDFPAALAFVREVFGVADGMPAKAVHKAAGKLPAWPSIEAAAEGFRRCNKRLAGATVERIFTCYEPDGKTPRGAEVRYMTPEGKQCRPFKFVAGAWHSGAPEKWTVYGRRELPPAGPVYVPEGPKCRDFMARLGFNSIASFGGASGAKKTEWEPLAGREVIIMPDADEPGERYAATVAEILHGMNCEIRTVRLPDLPEGGDVADLPGTPETAALVCRLAEDAEPWTRPAPVEALAVEVKPPTMGASVDRPLDPVQSAKAGKPYALTDLGNAERLVSWHGDSVRWDTTCRAWRVWDGKRWALDSALRVNALAADTVRRIRAEAAAAPSSRGAGADMGAELFKHAVRSEARDRLAALLDVAKSQPGIAAGAEAWDADPWALTVANGRIDLKSGKLRPHDRRDMATKITPVEYRPGERCDRFESFLADATGGDAELVEFLQTAAGYTLTGDTREEVLFLVHGPESSGKSTFLEVLRAVLGDFARTISTDLLIKSRGDRGAGAATPELAALAGARLAAASELEQGKEIAEALVKNLTGGEPIVARHLYAGPFTFAPQFKIWLALNTCPKVSADDGAMWRRIRRIGFEHTVPPDRRDKTLKPYLRSPGGGAPAVLAWAVAGCLKWQREGLRIPAAVERSTAAYRAESDPLAVFIAESLAFTAGAWTAWADVWAAYNEAAEDEGTPERFRVAPKRLQERLKRLGCVAERRYTGRGWAGVELKTAAPKRDHDAHDGYDATLQTFSHEENNRKSLGSGVIGVMSDMKTQKPLIFGTFQNGENSLANEVPRRDTPAGSDAADIAEGDHARALALLTGADAYQEEREYLYQERAAILEYDAKLPRPEAERRAGEMMKARTA